MAVDYGEDDGDALNFGQSRIVGSVNAVSLKSGKEHFGYFEGRFRAGTRTRESAQT